MESVPVAHPVHEAADDHLGLHVLAADAAHVLTAALFGNGIWHNPVLHHEIQREIRYVPEPLTADHVPQSFRRIIPAGLLHGLH